MTGILSVTMRWTGVPVRLGALTYDVDQFKPINDRYGHETGDRVLQQIVRRVRIEHGKPPIWTSLSLGVAGTRQYPASPDTLISRADAACYVAKRRGRRRARSLCRP